MESDAAPDAREWNRGTLEGGAFTQTLVGKPRARQPVVGPVSGELPAVRHRQPSARNKHAPALDIPAGWRALRRLQPQRQTTARPMGARLESALVKLQCVASLNTGDVTVRLTINRTGH